MRSRGLLADEVEVDEFFDGGVEEGLKGGRQRGMKVLVGVAVEVRGRGSGRLRLQVLLDATGDTLTAFVTATTAAGAIVQTDGWQGYKRPSTLDYAHRPIPRSAVVPGDDPLPRAHRAVSNWKAWMHGTHRGVSDEHLPVYLHEFVFRHNRRGTPMAAFQTLLGLGTSTPQRPTTRSPAEPPQHHLGANRMRTKALTDVTIGALTLTPGTVSRIPRILQA